MAYNGLFGRGFRYRQGVMKPEEAMPIGDKSEAGQRMVRSAAGGSATPGSAGGGWGGIFMRKNLGRTLQIAGAAMRDISDPSNGALNQFSANEAEQQAREMAMRAYEQRSMNDKQDREIAMQDREREQAASDAERLQRAQALLSIPEQLRPFAELGIEGPITQFYRSRYPTPSRAGGGPSSAPALPPGFDWE